MAKKYDWNKLEQDFLEGECLTVEEFFRQTIGKDKANAKNGYLARKTKGWADKKTNLSIQKKEKVIENSIEKAGDSEKITKMINDSLKGEEKALKLLLEKLEKGEVDNVLYQTTNEDGETKTRKKIGYRPLIVREITDIINALRIQQAKPNVFAKTDNTHKGEITTSPEYIEATNNLTKAIKSKK